MRVAVKIQDAIRLRCGDDGFILPNASKLFIRPNEAAAAAQALWSHPDLANYCGWHVAAAA